MQNYFQGLCMDFKTCACKSQIVLEDQCEMADLYIFTDLYVFTGYIPMLIAEHYTLQEKYLYMTGKQVQEIFLAWAFC